MNLTLFFIKKSFNVTNNSYIPLCSSSVPAYNIVNSFILYSFLNSLTLVFVLSSRSTGLAKYVDSIPNDFNFSFTGLLLEITRSNCFIFFQLLFI